MRTFHVLCVLFVVAYTRGIIERLGPSYQAANLAVELPVAILLSIMVVSIGCRLAPGLAFVVLFAFWVTLSGINSGDSFIQSLLYFRPLAYAYLVFWVTWNADLTGRDVLRLNRLLLSLWILQIAAALFEVLVLRQRVEAHVGTLAASGGAAATVFPLFAMGYIMAAYYYRRHSVAWLFLALAFGIVGYASGKRAIYFLMPTFYICIILWYSFRERSFAILRLRIMPLLVFALVVPVFLFGVRHSGLLSNNQNIATVRETISHAIEAAEEYSFGEQEEHTTGRFSTSLNVLQHVVGGDVQQFFWGFGPASLTTAGGKRAKEAMQIEYGVTGWTKDTLSAGWPAMLFHIGLYAYLWWRLSREQPAMWNDHGRAIHFGTHLAFATFFLVYFFYCDAFVLSGWFTYPHFYFLALLLSPNHRRLFCSVSRTRRPVPRRSLSG